MPATIYRSTDAGAPVLSGTSGALLTLLDAVLVNGYGSKAPAGWTKEFSDTNKAVYRNGAASVARRYFRIDDSLADPKFASMRGYYSMTDVDNGSGLFPTTAQSSGGIILYKSTTADSTARGWFAIADARTIFLAIDSSGDYVYRCHYCGDAISFVPEETSFSIVSGAYSSLYPNNLAIGFYPSYFNSPSDTMPTAMYIGGAGVPASYPATLIAGYNRGFAGWHATNYAQIPARLGYPNIDGSLIMNPAIIAHFTSYSGPVVCYRGRLRFFYDVPHSDGSFGNGDTFSGTGELSGKTFNVFRLIAPAYYTSSSTINYYGAVTVDD